MTVTPAFESYVLRQLKRVTPDGVRTRRLFGAINVYVGHRRVALLDHDKLFLKADDETRLEFEAAGMVPFRPFGDGHTMSYYEVPKDILAHPDALRPWATRALAAAERKEPPREEIEPAWKIKRLKRRKKRSKKKR